MKNYKGEVAHALRELPDMIRTAEFYADKADLHAASLPSITSPKACEMLKLANKLRDDACDFRAIMEHLLSKRR